MIAVQRRLAEALARVLGVRRMCGTEGKRLNTD